MPTSVEQSAQLFQDAEQHVAVRSEFSNGLRAYTLTGLLSRLTNGNLSLAQGLLDCVLTIVLRFPVHGTPLAELAAAACS